MTRDQVLVLAIALSWAGGAAAVGLGLAWVLRRRSVRVLTVTVALVAVGSVLAGMLGTARAMFLSPHDFGVVLLVSVAAGAVGLGFALAVGGALARWSRSLREDARRFGESGEFAAEGRGPAELREVSEELARTADRLRASHERETRLEESRRELISWVSHDLRSPLAAIRAMSEAVEDGIAQDPERYQRQIRREVDRMVRMVDDLFELSRIHAGVLPLSLEEVALGDIVSEAIAGADSVARAGGVRLDGAVEDGLSLRADPGELSRVVTNLLLNAIRHTPTDGVVEVSGRAVDQGVELSVTDSCGGLPAEDMRRIFDVGWQGTPARTPSRDGQAGAGLGLAIVKGIVEAHAGRVAVSNQHPGCRFVVNLPA